MEKLLLSGFPLVLLILLGTVLAVVFAALALQGRELADYVVDNRGIHEIRYLPDPTPVKLLARLESPARMKEAAGQDTSVPVLRLSEKNLAWKDVARVQLWPEKCTVLFYAPARWLRSAVICTPFTWDDVMELTRNKLGKKRKILLPQSLVVPAEPKIRRQKPQAEPAREVEEALEQLRMEEMMSGGPGASADERESGQDAE